jgi:glutamine amidotransferase
VIAIVDYGIGNIQAFLNVYKRLNIEAKRAATGAELAGATKLLLPGVGAFDHAMESLNASGMREALDDLVLRKHIPVLGVCVGMQMLSRGSEEGSLPGFGWIDARVKKLDSLGEVAALPLPLPHMGWNDVHPKPGNQLFHNLELDARFYFLHSYFFSCARRQDVAADSRYGGDFCCAVSAGHIHGVQFHPEKSHRFGTQLLQNFAAI